MSGVQIDNSPAVATRSLDISSWKDGDISTLTSSEKKRYYRRKSALKAYFTTQEPLDQVALRYHLPAKMLEKLAKRCAMQHEDSTPWGFRALVPGVNVVDHAPEAAPQEVDTDIIPEDAQAQAATSNQDANVDAMFEDASADAIHQDEDVDTKHENVDTILEETNADAVRTDMVKADAVEADATDLESTAENDGGTRLIASASTIDDSPPASNDNTLASSIDDSPVSSNEDESSSAIDDTPASTIDDSPAPARDDDEDTVQSRAIVLPEQDPPPANEMPDIIGIEETGIDGIENNIGNAVETQEVTDLEHVVEDAVETQLIASASMSNTVASPDEEITIEATESVLSEDEVPPTSEKQAEPVVVESIVAIPDNQPGVAPSPVPEISQGNSGALYMPELPRKTSRSLVVRGQLLPNTLPGVSKEHAAITGKRVVVAQRSIRKRWVRNVERTRRHRSHRMISAVIVATIFLSLLIPVGAGIAAYSAYNSIKGIALDGVNHLLNVKTLLPASKNDLTAVLNPTKLQQANLDFTQAEGDFLQLQQLVNRQDIQNLVQQLAPQYSDKLGMAQHLVQVGIDVTRMGNELINVAMLGANVLHGSPLATGSTKPLVTTNDISNIEGTMLHALYYIQDIKAQMSQVVLNQLPISVSEQKQISSAMTLLPKAQSYLEQGQGVIGIVSWLLGVGQPRRFLVQTMDRAELRPSGGFTGQYGVFSVQDGRMAPFTLQDVTELDYNGNGAELGRQAPPGYTSWMNFGNFGLRDANISGDFPTTARLAMQVFQEEGGGPVDGDIMFTPTTIEHVLDIVGPLKIPEYNETITAQNLEDKLHYYQNDPAAINLQRQKTGTHNAATRKTFTALVGTTLLSTVRHLPVKTLLKVVENAAKDIQARDLEIYFNNPQAEAWLVGHSYSGAMSTFSNTDGFMVVQSNISISKNSQDVQTTEQDQITLDAQGGATHNLTITLDYEGTKPIYSTYTTYADYIRVYAPANAVLQGGDGFDTGKALCSPTPPTPTNGTGGTGKPTHPTTGGTSSCDQLARNYASNTLYCPSGNYSMGPRGWVNGKFSNWSFDVMGAPTELTSDLPGRAMWGGLTVTPKNCISTITLSWYVPNVVKHVTGQPVYSVLVQKQGGYIPIVQISIDTSQLKGVKPYSFNGGISADRLFSLAVVKKGH